MLKKLSELWNRWATEGLRLPFARDPVAEAPSVTLLTYYIMLILMVGSLIALHFKIELIVATGTTVLAWCLAFLFYRLRKLDSFKIDLDDQSIEVDSSEEKDENVKDS